MLKTGPMVILAILMMSAMLVPLSMAKSPVNSGTANAGTAAKVYPSIFSAQVSNPSVAYTGQHITVYVNLTYGFENYNITIYFAGENLTGMTPTNTYHHFSGNSSYFTVPMIMPSTPQTLIFDVDASATTNTGIVSYSVQHQIQVRDPLVLHAVISNPTSVPIQNAKVTFLIDGSVVSTKVISNVPAHGSTNVQTSVILSRPLSRGTHTITVQVDSSVALVNGAGSSYSSTFYYGTPPNFTWIYYVAGAVVIFMVFLAFASGRRSSSAGGPKWRR